MTSEIIKLNINSIKVVSSINDVFDDYDENGGYDDEDE